MIADVATRPGRHFVSLALLVVLALGLGAGYLVFRASQTMKIPIRARQAVSERKFDQGREFIAKWQAQDPKAGEPYFLLARVELASNNGQEVINALAKALELGYPANELAPYRAVIQAKSEQYDQAEPVLRKALADSDAPQPEIAEALAGIYLATFRLPQATGPLDRWMRDAPDDPRPYLLRNEIETRRDADHSVLIQNYREALKRDPNLAAARLGLADRLRQAHRLDEAALEYETYIKLKPDDPDGHTGAGRVALERSNTDEAVQHFERALKWNPKEPIALKELGVIDLNRGNPQRARDRLQEVIKIDPFDPDTHFNLARALRLLGDPTTAKIHDDLAQKLRGEHSRMADLRSSLVKKPKDIAIRIEIAEWLLNHAHDDEGLLWAKQILHDHPGHEPTIRLLIDYYGRKKNPGQANYYRMLLQQAEPAAKKTS